MVSQSCVDLSVAVDSKPPPTPKTQDIPSEVVDVDFDRGPLRTPPAQASDFLHIYDVANRALENGSFAEAISGLQRCSKVRSGSSLIVRRSCDACCTCRCVRMDWCPVMRRLSWRRTFGTASASRISSAFPRIWRGACG
jgi:hypothetical protein